MYVLDMDKKYNSTMYKLVNSNKTKLKKAQCHSM